MTKYILVVGPAAPIVSVYRRQFEAQGVMIDACETFAEAVELLKMQSYDAAVMDIGHAGEDQKTLDLLSVLRERRPDVKIILMTRGGNYDAENKAAELGASFFFDKPVFSSTIFEALKELGITK
jgi:DNA-binding NtrC family response regulator